MKNIHPLSDRHYPATKASRYLRLNYVPWTEERADYHRKPRLQNGSASGAWGVCQHDSSHQKNGE